MAVDRWYEVTIYLEVRYGTDLSWCGSLYSDI